MNETARGNIWALIPCSSSSSSSSSAALKVHTGQVWKPLYKSVGDPTACNESARGRPHRLCS
eukprot:6119480-Karenia_brevis.AAC.1